MDSTPRPDAVDAITGQWNEVRPDLPTEAMAVFGRIFRISRTMTDRLGQAHAAHGIAKGEFDVIGTLRRSGAPYTLSPRELTATLMLTTGGMTGRLDKLERAGLITRSPDPHDRRGLRITLTPEGLALVDRAVDPGVAIYEETLAVLSPEERATLDDLLRRLLASATH
ncbi:MULTISPECIES: MarR family winged helix-turn-helix transcriptional regulator [unclassified Kitasatospora]|uniref:MarR family winged helix-turn-helix transcriptional regulator n=1 Tax=unclassified Kitasatospora TaxID=2633591 RepID=UPI00070F785F|nr:MULTISPECIES: MarR family transcriptional regulator [unclassified Kitasatospora]KQV05489.1 MarR family transcriptional regulator [Kitasatospora sp. Root107]KRB62294.1 MarR family transcriptional regulator [Kitasatospora sp. Root187]